MSTIVFASSVAASLCMSISFWKYSFAIEAAVIGGFFSISCCIIAPGDPPELKLCELCLDGACRRGVPDRWFCMFDMDLLLLRSGVDDLRSGFSGLDEEGVRDGDCRGTGGGTPSRCSFGVFRGDFAGEDSGSGVPVAVSRMWFGRLSCRFVCVDGKRGGSVGGSGKSSVSMDGRGMSWSMFGSPGAMCASPLMFEHSCIATNAVLICLGEI